MLKGYVVYILDSETGNSQGIINPCCIGENLSLLQPTNSKNKHENEAGKLAELTELNKRRVVAQEE